MSRAWFALGTAVLFGVLVSMAACVGSEPAVGATDSGTSDGASDATNDVNAFDGSSGDAAPDAGSMDASDSGTAADAADSGDAARCNPSSAFGAAVALSTLNTGSNEEVAFLSPDELTLYFSSTRSGGVGNYDIYVATRANTMSGFSGVGLVASNTAGVERDPGVSGDGLFLYASTYNGTDFDISIASRANTLAPFGALAVAGGVNGTSHDDDPYPLPDHSAVYFASSRGGTMDLYRSARVGVTLQAPTAVVGSNLNTTAAESAPTVSLDELTLFFSSDRSGGVGNGDIWMATRASTSVGFGAPVNLSSVNTGDNDIPSWISADGCVLYITRLIRADGGPLVYALFYATRGM